MADLWSNFNSTTNNTNSVTSPLFGGLVNTQGAASTYSINQTTSANTTPTIIPFTPSTNTNFQFQATLDGNTYNVIVNWNLYGQRYYVNIYDLSNALIVALPLVGSPLNYNISLTAGYFTTQLIYVAFNQQFVII